MSVKLAILGILKRGPVHGYELKSVIEREMGDWTSIAFGSVYFALKKLTENGYVEQSFTDNNGNRPSKIIYRITDEGEIEFTRLLREIWNNSDRQYFTFDIALFFSKYITKPEALNFIDTRIAEIDFAEKHVEFHKNEQISKEGIPPVAEAIFTHTLSHLSAEKKWLEDIKKYFK